MTRKEKIKERFLSNPSDFRWSELLSLLEGFGYRLKKGSSAGGSRRKFIHPNGDAISLHEPHPQKVLKHYQIREIARHLRQEGHL